MQETDRLNGVIAPNIFDCHANTNLLLPLVLGNLLSKKLWDISSRIQNKLLAYHSGVSPPLEPLLYVRSIQDFIDRKFKHLHPNEVGLIYGELCLEDERQRLGQEIIDSALAQIEAVFIKRVSDGSIPFAAFEALNSRIKLGYFPAFTYGNIDLIMANRALAGKKSSAPMGITSCLDECAIFASLAMTMPGGTIENVIALTSVSHYTVFGWTASGESWWFYGKNLLFSKDDWSTCVNSLFDGDAQRGFDSYFKEMTHVVSVAGTLDLTTGVSSITLAHIQEIIEKMHQFFGVQLKQVSPAVSGSLQILEESAFASPLRDLIGLKSLEQARTALMRTNDPSLSHVLYSYRSLDVKYIAPYLLVARQQPLCKVLARTLGSRSDAIELIRNLNGSDSIFDDRSRIQMPDETLRLRTGTDRDKALLLHVLLEHIDAHVGHTDPIVTLCTRDDSYVCGQDFCISLTTLCEASPPEVDILYVLQA